MSRLSLTFECQGHTLAGTLDTAAGKTGLLIVSGGNEIRAGAFGGQSRIAAKIAEAGFPVFRFDRRGIGDSDGENRGFRKSRKDNAAALDAFRAMAPQLDRVIAFGNCDAASALMLDAAGDFDGLILSNPWTIDGDDDGATTPEAARGRYAEKLKNPKELVRLLTGKVSFTKLAGGLKQALGPKSKPTSLAQEMVSGLASADKPYRILLATKDRTASLFEANWTNTGSDIRRCEGASHAYVEPHAMAWLEQQILDMLRA